MKSITLKAILVLIVSAVLLVSCNNPSSKNKTTSEASSTADWSSLFNGEDLDGWYTYQKQPEPTSEVDGLARNDDGS